MMHWGHVRRILCASVLFISSICYADQITMSNVFDTCRFISSNTLVVCAAEPTGTLEFFQKLKKTQVLYKLSLINNVTVVGLMPMHVSAGLFVDCFDSIQALQNWVRLQKGEYTSILYFSTRKGLNLLRRAELESFLSVSTMHYVQYDPEVPVGKSQIVQTRDIGDVLKYAIDDQTLVLFDIDGTLVDMVDIPGDKDACLYRLIEGCITQYVLAELKRRGCKIMCLSSRRISSAQVSSEYLWGDFKFDMSADSLFKEKLFLLTQVGQGRRPYLYHCNGICTIGPEGDDAPDNVLGYFKGKHLKQLLIDHIPKEKWPKRIIMVDDYHRCVVAVIEEMADLDPKLEVVGMWYTRCDEDKQDKK